MLTVALIALAVYGTVSLAVTVTDKEKFMGEFREESLRKQFHPKTWTVAVAFTMSTDEVCQITTHHSPLYQEVQFLNFNRGCSVIVLRNERTESFIEDCIRNNVGNGWQRFPHHYGVKKMMFKMKVSFSRHHGFLIVEVKK